MKLYDITMWKVIKLRDIPIPTTKKTDDNQTFGNVY